MAEFVLTKRAEADLYDLALFGLERFGERQVEAYLAELDRVFGLLADHPRMAAGLRRSRQMCGATSIARTSSSMKRCRLASGSSPSFTAAACAD